MSIEAAEESGNLSALLGIVHSSVDDMDNCEEGLSAIYRLLGSMPTVDLGEDSSRALDLVAICLQKYVDEPSILEVLFGCIRVCAAKSLPLQSLLCTPDNISYLITAMNTHTDGEETLQEQGSLVICEFAKGSPENTQILLKAGVEAALEQAARLITNERNKKYPVLAKEALGI